LLAYSEHPRALLLSKTVVNVILIYRVRAGDDLLRRQAHAQDVDAIALEGC
jgi:hypothetical protein